MPPRGAHTGLLAPSVWKGLPLCGGAAEGGRHDCCSAHLRECLRVLCVSVVNSLSP